MNTDEIIDKYNNHINIIGIYGIKCENNKFKLHNPSEDTDIIPVFMFTYKRLLKAYDKENDEIYNIRDDDIISLSVIEIDRQKLIELCDTYIINNPIINKDLIINFKKLTLPLIRMQYPSLKKRKDENDKDS